MAGNAFRRRMSTVELVEWLHCKGVSDKDCKVIEDEEFTSESFLLLDKATCKDLGLKMAAQLLVMKLVKEANQSPLDPLTGEGTDELRISENDDTCTPERNFQIPLCAEPPDDLVGASCPVPPNRSGAAGACVFRCKLWEGIDALKVCFMNPKVLEGWMCDGKRMSVDMIMEWVRVWEQAPSAPKFIVTSNPNKADIRVKFSGVDACSSLVGSQASSAPFDKATMTLNLSDSAYPKSFRRHLVIHEFGHALGLEHEHQRSNFWDTVKEFMDMERMVNDPRFGHYRRSPKGRVEFGRDYLEVPKAGGDCCSSEYDSKSIMHYWFDVLWLKNKTYHKRRGITSDPNLTAVQKKCLMGIHDRNNNCAPEPSLTDITILERAYCGGDK